MIIPRVSLLVLDATMWSGGLLPHCAFMITHTVVCLLSPIFRHVHTNYIPT